VADVDYLDSPGRLRRFQQPSQARPPQQAHTQTHTSKAQPPRWPAILFQDAIRRAFDAERETFERLGSSVERGMDAFNASTPTESTREPEAATTLTPEQFATLRGRVGATYLPRWDLAEGVRALLEPLPFYRGYSLLSLVGPGPQLHKPLLVTANTYADGDPHLTQREAVWDDVASFEQRLRHRNEFQLTPELHAAYVCFRVGWERRTPVEAPSDLPLWLDGYGERARETIAPQVRPLTTLCTSDRGSVTAVLSEGGSALLLELWTLAPHAASVSCHWLVVDRDHAFPERASEHVRPRCDWMVAWGLHHPAYEAALEPFRNGDTSVSGPRIWAHMYRERKRPVDQPDEFRAGRDEYERIRAQLVARRAGVWIPEEGSRGETMVLRGHDLDFYRGFALYGLGQGQRVAKFVAHRGADPSEATPVVVLDGTSQPIHKLNGLLAERGELHITTETAEQYVRFFGENVHADQGPFNIVERTRELEWRFETDAVEEALAGVLWPLIRVCSAADGTTVIQAFVGYGRDLYMALFKVGTDGFIVMLDDTRLLSDLPIHPQSLDDLHDATFVMLA
jgi:hypothetical protein